MKYIKSILEFKNMGCDEYVKKVFNAEIFKKTSKIELIEEGVGDNYLYHLTYPNKILNILRTDTLNLSTRIDAKYTSKHNLTNKPFHISLSRTPNSKLGYGRMEYSRIVFNKNKLKNKYQIIPYDSWGEWSSRDVTKTAAFKGDRPQKEINYELNQRYEYEDWLMSNKPFIKDIISYIERIDLLVRGFSKNDDNNNNFINRVVDLCKELGIKVFVYKSREDMSYGRNAIEVPEYVEMGYYHGDKDYESRTFDWVSFIAIILYNQKYLDDYDLCVKDAKDYAVKNDIPLENGDKVYNKMRDIKLDNKDTLTNLINHVHNFFMDGNSGIIRDKINLLVNDMKKHKARSIDDLAKCKVLGLRPLYSPKIDWSAKYQLGKYHKEYWFDDNSPVTYNPIPNDNEFKTLKGFYYTTYGYGGEFDQDDFKAINEIDTGDKPISNFINYLFNKYTVEKAIEKIEYTGYDSHDKINYYKVLPIKGS